MESTHLAQGKCIAGGCNRKLRTKTLCFTHYNRLRRRGDIHWQPKGALWREAWKLWKAAKYRARDLSLDFSITVEFVMEKMRIGKCEVSNAELKVGAGERSPWSASLDRKNPALGYTSDNVQLVCWMYNAAKGSGTHEDVMELARLLTRKLEAV